MQWTLYPTETYGIDGTLQDLVTVFASNHSSFIFKNYGIDTPTIINRKASVRFFRICSKVSTRPSEQHMGSYIVGVR